MARLKEFILLYKPTALLFQENSCYYVINKKGVAILRFEEYDYKEEKKEMHLS